MAKDERSGGITVRELLATDHLDLTLLAGAGGLDRKVLWTHVSELKQPQLWLDGGELLITNGLGLSDDPREQAEFIAGLAGKRLAGLALGILGPSLHPEAAALADELAFPVLHVPKPVPFVSIARLVADCNSDHAQRRMATHLRLFDTLRGGCDAASAPSLVAKLEAISGYRLFLTTPAGMPLVPGLDGPPSVVVELLERSPGEVARQSYSISNGHVVPIPLAERTAGFLVAIERPDAEPAGLGAVRHMATIGALLVSNVYRERELERRRGAELLARIFAGADVDDVAALLRRSRFDGDQLRIVKVRAGDQVVGELHHRLCDVRVPHLVLAEEDEAAYLVVDDDLEPLEALIADLDVIAGASAPLAPTGHWLLSRVESERALDRALSQGKPAGTLLRYSAADSPLEWLGTDPATLAAFSEKVLGPLVEYDRANNAALLQSLRVYLECDRRVTVAAERLFVHKHTLAYRLKRIEEITGRRMGSMDDLCVLWLALRAVDAGRRASDDAAPPRTAAVVAPAAMPSR